MLEPSPVNRPDSDRRGGGQEFTTSKTAGPPKERTKMSDGHTRTVGSCGAVASQATRHCESHAVSTSERFKIEFAADREFIAKLEKIRSRLSGRFPQGLSMEKLFGILMDEYLEKHDPERKMERRKMRKHAGMGQSLKMKGRANSSGAAEVGCEKQVHDESCGQAAVAREHNTRKERSDNSVEGKQISSGPVEVEPNEHEIHGYQVKPGNEGGAKPARTRHIPAHIRDRVYTRDGGRCRWIAPDGTRCDSKWDLEIDHIHPFALGGDHSPENLRLLCAAHNRLEAVIRFGSSRCAPGA